MQAQPVQPGMPMQPMTDPNQVTTKPRQLPGDGAGQGGGFPGEQPIPGEGFDPKMNGADTESLENDPDADASEMDDAPKVAAIVQDVLRTNPGIDMRKAIFMAARAHHLMGPQPEGLALVAAAPPERPEGRGEPREPVSPMLPGARQPDAPLGSGDGSPYHEFGQTPADLANADVPAEGTAWQERNA